MMKTTTEKAVVAYRILNNAKIGKMKDGDQYTIIKAMKELKPVAVSYDDFIKDASEKLKPEGIEEIQGKVAGSKALTPDEDKVWQEYNQKVAKCVQDELQKEVEFSFQPLSEEGFKGLLSSNDFSLAEIMALNEVIAQ